MARWSKEFRIRYYTDHVAKEAGSGVYEFGFVVNNTFYAKYVGETSDLRRRFSQYFDRDRSCNSFVLGALDKPNFYVHYFRTEHHRSVEARLLYRHDIGKSGLYAFNKQYEYTPLIKNGWEFG